MAVARLWTRWTRWLQSLFWALMAAGAYALMRMVAEAVAELEEEDPNG